LSYHGHQSTSCHKSPLRLQSKLKQRLASLATIYGADSHHFPRKKKEEKKMSMRHTGRWICNPGMRFGETRKLKWSYVDFENKILTVPRELTKCDREHRLPLSDFLMGLLKRRYVYGNNSEWVFQSVRNKNKCLSEGIGIVRRVRAKSGIKFTMHDLRRTFLTMGEKLEVPSYVLKKLVNHSVNDITGQYLILDIERLRGPCPEFS